MVLSRVQDFFSCNIINVLVDLCSVTKNQLQTISGQVEICDDKFVIQCTSFLMFEHVMFCMFSFESISYLKHS